MSSSQQTTDHERIRRWVEARNGKPARVQGTGSDDVGILRIDFPEAHEDVDAKRLAFVYQEKTAAGEPSRFNRFVNR